jgi:CheY-like chemotaxis protein
MNILIVEDELDIQMLYQDFLNSHLPGNKTTVARDGIEAYLKCTTELYDLIILDYKMPRMNGIDFLATLRGGGLNEQTKVIFSSGALPDLESSSELPNTFFLNKPLDFKKFGNLLHSLL